MNRSWFITDKAPPPPHISSSLHSLAAAAVGVVLTLSQKKKKKKKKKEEKKNKSLQVKPLWSRVFWLFCVCDLCLSGSSNFPPRARARRVDCHVVRWWWWLSSSSSSSLLLQGGRDLVVSVWKCASATTKTKVNPAKLVTYFLRCDGDNVSIVSVATFFWDHQQAISLFPFVS